MEGYFTATSTFTPAKNLLPGSPPPQNAGPSCQTYEIIMVSLSGGLFLLAVIVIAVQTIQKRMLHFQRQVKLRPSTKVFSVAEVVVPNIGVKDYDGEEIFTAEIVGPARVSYISEKKKPFCDILTSETKPDSDKVSFTSSVIPPDTSPKL